MDFLDNTKIGTKLIASFLIIAAILGIVAVIGYTNMKTINDGMTSMYYDKLIPIQDLGTAESAFLTLRGDLYKYIAIPDQRTTIKSSFADSRKTINDMFVKYRATKLMDSEVAGLKVFDAAWVNYQTLFDDAIVKVDAGKEKEVIDSLGSGSMSDARKAVGDAINNLQEINRADAERINTEADAIFAVSVLIITFSGVIGVIAAVGLGIIISRSITIPLGKTVAMITEMSLGHFGMRLSFTRKDEIGVMSRSMDSFANDQQQVVIGGMNRIASGDLSLKIIPKDDRDEIAPALAKTVSTLNDLVSEAGRLTEAAVSGELKTRGDADRFEGGYRKIVEGVNKTLDAVIVPVNEAMRLAGRYAERDFSARVDPNLVVQGDFEKFKSALDDIGLSVSGAVDLIQKQVNELVAAAEEANASIEEIGAGSNQIAQNANKVSINAEGSEQGINQVLQAMEDLSQAVSQVSARTDQVSKLSIETEHLTKKGAELAESAEQGMNGIITSSQEIGTIISEIKNQMEDIGRIVGIIGDIADQTNLLALNAAIEAARAGEAGLGFAVVADEVKALALDVQKSAENIENIIINLQKKSETAAEAMKSSNEEVKLGSSAVSDTLKVFTDIVTAIEKISNNVTDVASATEEQAASVEEVTSSIHEISKMAQDTAKEATDAAAASEEASAAIDQIAQVVAGVSRNVQQIAGEMNKFTI